MGKNATLVLSLPTSGWPVVRIACHGYGGRSSESAGARPRSAGRRHSITLQTTLRVRADAAPQYGPSRVLGSRDTQPAIRGQCVSPCVLGCVSVCRSRRDCADGQVRANPAL